MFDISAVLVITLTFLFAGTVKGVIGLGLPTVSLGLLTVAFDLTSAMALLLVPSFVTNVWQALAGEKTRETFLRIWPFLLAACATVGVGAAALTRLDHQWLSVLLGVLLIIYALVSFSCLGGCWHRCCERRTDWDDRLFRGTGGDLSAGDRIVARCTDSGDGHVVQYLDANAGNRYAK